MLLWVWTLGLACRGFTLWPSKSRGRGSSQPKVWTFCAWPLEASHYAQLKAPLTIFYWLFSAHFFGLSTKIGHSIARPLDLDGHSVNRPFKYPNSPKCPQNATCKSSMPQDLMLGLWSLPSRAQWAGTRPTRRLHVSSIHCFYVSSTSFAKLATAITSVSSLLSPRSKYWFRDTHFADFCTTHHGIPCWRGYTSAHLSSGGFSHWHSWVFVFVLIVGGG